MLRLAAYEARLTSQLLATARLLEKLQKGRADAGEVMAEGEPPAENEPADVSDDGQPDETSRQASSPSASAERVTRVAQSDSASPADAATPGAERSHSSEDASRPTAPARAPDPPDAATNPATRRPGGRGPGPL
jgi:hypothetical protein